MNKTITFDTLTHKVVPVEPTEEMSHAAVTDAPCIIKKHYACDGKYTGQIVSLDSAMFADSYRSMLAAVPDQLHGVVEYSGEPVAKAIIADWRGLALEMLRNWDDLPTDTLLYDHPAPSQLDPFEEVYCALKGCEPHGLASCDDFKDWKASLSAPSQPSALYWHGREIKTQADLIALVKEWAEKGFDAASQPRAEQATIGGHGFFAGLKVNIDHSLPPSTVEMRGSNRVRLNIDTGEITEYARIQPSAEALVQAALEAAAKECETSPYYEENGRDTRGLCSSCIRALSAQQIVESCKEKS